jgi:hypothetical protein
LPQAQKPPFPKLEASPPGSSTIKKSIGSGRGSARAEKRVKAPSVRESESGPGSGSGTRREAPLLDKAVKKQIDLELGVGPSESPIEPKGKKRKGRHLLGPGKLRPRVYRREVARRLEKISEQKKKEAQDLTLSLKVREEALELGLSMEAKAKRYKLCGQYVWYRQCGGCGNGRAETGLLHSPAKPCQGRTCEVCGGVRSEVRGKELTERIKQLQEVEGYSLRHIVVTVKYRPWSEEDVTIEAYRNRIVRVKKAVSKLWKNRLKKYKGSALYQQIEISPFGAVHVHLLHYGPYVAKKKMEGYLKEQYPEIGFSWIESVKAGDEKSAVLEVTKYVTKAHSALNEDAWLEGCERLHPELAARIEAATYMLKLTEHFGVLRGKLEIEEEVKEEAAGEERKGIEDDQEVVCTSCGVQGEWSWGLLPTEQFIRQCHDRNENALAYSRRNKTKRSKLEGPAP